MDLARTFENDMYPGIGGTNGRILTNDNPKTINLINSALRKVNRDLRNEGVTFPIIDNFIIQGLPPVNPTNDPSVEVYVGFNGYFDGTTLHGDKALPGNCMQVLDVGSRNTGSNLPFYPMCQPQSSLPSGYPGPWLPLWRWSQYKVFMNGSTQEKDLRIQYQSGQPALNTPPANFETTNIFIIDCEEAMASWIAFLDTAGRGGDVRDSMLQIYSDAISQMANEWVRRAQSVTYQRMSYQGGGSTGQQNDVGQASVTI